MMMNRVKKELIIPQCMTRANITILHKKDCKLDLNNMGGIFCSLLRNILLKLIYEEKKHIILYHQT